MFSYTLLNLLGFALGREIGRTADSPRSGRCAASVAAEVAAVAAGAGGAAETAAARPAAARRPAAGATQGREGRASR